MVAQNPEISFFVIIKELCRLKSFLSEKRALGNIKLKTEFKLKQRIKTFFKQFKIIQNLRIYLRTQNMSINQNKDKKKRIS